MDTTPESSPSWARKAQEVAAQPIRRDYVTGILLLLCVVILWTAGNFFTQTLFEGGYEKPFLVTYLNTSAFSLYLLPYAIQRWRERRGHSMANLAGEYQPLINESGADVEDTPSIGQVPASVYTHDESTPLSRQETAQLAFIFCFLWFIANWSVNAALDYTSVASATIMSSMSGFFTLAVGQLFRVENLTMMKVLGVFTSFGGVLLVSLSDSRQGVPTEPLPSPVTSSGAAPIFGDALGLLSAVFYAIYVILLKVRIRNEARIDMRLFFGFVGLFNVLTCWPIGLGLHLLGVEKLELPTTTSQLIVIGMNMAVTLSSDYIYVFAMLKTTPLVVTLGLSLTIPLAIVGDFFLGRAARGQVLLGAALVLISFIIVGGETAIEKEGLLENDDTIDEQEPHPAQDF